MKYTSPKYEREIIETCDVMTASQTVIDPTTGAVLTEETDTLAKVAVSVKNLFKFSN
jgi:hypothetical protein